MYGSLDELKADFGDYPRDHEGNVNMHRPYIDELTRVNPDDPTGKSHMHRITDVDGLLVRIRFHELRPVPLPV